MRKRSSTAEGVMGREKEKECKVREEKECKVRREEKECEVRREEKECEVRKEKEKECEVRKEKEKECEVRKENKIMPFAATWIQSEIIILSEVSQKEKDKYHMISLTFGV